MMNQDLLPNNKDPKRRPYWHVDLKWISGITLFGVVSLLLIVLVAHRATSRDTSVPLMENVIKIYVDSIPVNQADQDAIEELRKKIQESPTGSIQPIPGLPVTLTEEDLQKSAAEIRDKIFGPTVGLAAPIYDKGLRQVAEEKVSDKAEQDKFVSDASLFGFFTKERHEQIGVWAIVLGIVAAILAAKMIFFSSGAGRLVSPAVVLIVASVPGLIVFYGLKTWVNKTDQQVTSVENIGELVAANKDALLPLVSAGQNIYLAAFKLAIVLLVAAVIFKFVGLWIGRSRSKPIKQQDNSSNERSV